MADLILLVDDEPNILRALVRLLKRRDFDAVTAPGAPEALDMLAAANPLPKVIVSDYRMPRMDGVEFLAQVRQRWPHVQRVLLTGQADVKAVEQAVNEAAVDRFMSKPWEEMALLSVLRSAVRQHDLEQERQMLDRLARQRLEELRVLNASLEAKVAERTELFARTKRTWERTVDALEDPVAAVSADRIVERANTAFARARGLDVKGMPQRACWEGLGGNSGPCPGCTLDAAVAGATPAAVEITLPTGITFRHRAQSIADDRAAGPAAVCLMRELTRREP
ncbi:MAG TPA: response regulator [Myxococcota bacterium]|jgi:two-component system NtrC family sensor kinase|nr:response regulator [Myxococcota bacterium]